MADDLTAGSIGAPRPGSDPRARFAPDREQAISTVQLSQISNNRVATSSSAKAALSPQTSTNPDMTSTITLDPASLLVVTQFFDAAGKLTDMKPSHSQLQAYQFAALTAAETQGISAMEKRSAPKDTLARDTGAGQP